MSNVVRDLRLQNGTIQTEEFMLTGNFEAAYLHLKKMFDGIKKPSQSGPIKPMTKEEIKLEQNKPTADMLEELPPSNYHQF